MDITKEKTITVKLVGKEGDDFIALIGSIKKEVTKVGLIPTFYQNQKSKY